jgi:hypothetical protein
VEKIILAMLLAFALTGCGSISFLSPEKPSIEDTKLTRSLEYQLEIDKLLALDADNKKWEKIFLKEIEAAQKNEDEDAFQFFLREYIAIPRLKLPDWIKKEKGYVEGGLYFIDLYDNIKY